MHEYVATFRAGYKADDDVQARVIAESICELALDNILEPDDDDEMFVSQVIDYAPADVPHEIINVLVKARNTLIKSRLQRAWDLAHELDRLIFQLEHGDWKSLVPYDNRFLDITEAILGDGNATR